MTVPGTTSEVLRLKGMLLQAAFDPDVMMFSYSQIGLPRLLSGKEHTCGCRRYQRWKFKSDPVKEEMATHSSILAWKIQWIEEPGRLRSMGSKNSDMTVRLSMPFSNAISFTTKI